MRRILAKSYMQAILQSLLIIAVTFVYVAGPYLTVAMEHSHEVGHGHGHEHAGDDHSHHSHDHGPIPSSEAPENGDPDGDSHSHTHVVSLGADAPFTPFPHNAFVVRRNGINHPAAAPEFVPDGPCFPLIKPPQLG